MKRILSLLCVLSLLLMSLPAAAAAKSGVSIALSDEAADLPEIRYQDMEWGAKRDTVRKTMIKAGLVKKKINWSFASAGGDTIGHFAINPDDFAGWDFYDGYQGGATSDWIYPSEIGGKIAGYSASRIYLEYLYNIGKNNKVDKKDPRLSAVVIDLVTPSVSSALTDLKEKLSGLYGEAVPVPYAGWIWYGGNRTAVMLIEFDDFVTLLYSRVDSFQRLKEVTEIANPTPNKHDTSGL